MRSCSTIWGRKVWDGYQAKVNISGNTVLLVTLEMTQIIMICSGLCRRYMKGLCKTFSTIFYIVHINSILYLGRVLLLFVVLKNINSNVWASSYRFAQDHVCLKDYTGECTGWDTGIMQMWQMKYRTKINLLHVTIYNGFASCEYKMFDFNCQGINVYFRNLLRVCGYNLRLKLMANLFRALKSSLWNKSIRS